MDKGNEVLNDIRDSIKEIQKTQTDILVNLAKVPCKRHDDRIKLIERIVFGLVAVVLMAFMVKLTDPVKIKSQSATATPLVKEQIKK